MSIWHGFDTADVEIHMDEITAEGAEYERECRAEAGAWNEIPEPFDLRTNGTNGNI
ncbi:hypothetical protein ACIQUM_36230 [Amycolatopsis azurea]|uniref:hypothetical protein n=1 Tax=Amycolatopsis azurea TaxID=36819 RepID=UPI0037FBC8CF